MPVNKLLSPLGVLDQAVVSWHINNINLLNTTSTQDPSTKLYRA